MFVFGLPSLSVMSRQVQVGSNQFVKYDKQANRDAARLPEAIQYEPKASLASSDGYVKAGPIWGEKHPMGSSIIFRGALSDQWQQENIQPSHSVTFLCACGAHVHMPIFSGSAE